MKFDLTSKNFNVTKELSPKLDASLNRLRHALNSFPKIEKPAEIILEKRLRSEEYKAKITFHLPKHTISTKDVGSSPEQALYKAADDARDKVLKIKDRFKDIHEQLRRSKAKGIRSGV